MTYSERLIERYFDAIAHLDGESAAALVSDDYVGRPFADAESEERGPAGLCDWIEEMRDLHPVPLVEDVTVESNGETILVAGRCLGGHTQFACVVESDGDFVTAVRAFATLDDAKNAVRAKVGAR